MSTLFIYLYVCTSLKFSFDSPKQHRVDLLRQSLDSSTEKDDTCWEKRGVTEAMGRVGDNC